MSARQFPALDAGALAPTRDAVHAYAQVLGNWAEGRRRRRKHWWHISLRPSIRGLTTDVIRNAPDFELELDLVNSRLDVHCELSTSSLKLCGQSPRELAGFVERALEMAGVAGCDVPADSEISDEPYPDYSAEMAGKLHQAFAAVAAALEELRAGIREETSPIQVWPHHFDLSMIWLPGTRVMGVDHADEEAADKQMNFGFVPGDTAIPEPYFYVTAYPHPDDLLDVELPPGTLWQTEGFTGAVLKYRDLVAMDDPADYLCTLWDRLIEAGRRHLCNTETAQ